MSGTLRIDWAEAADGSGIGMTTREPWTEAHTRRFDELGAVRLGLRGGDAPDLAFLRDLTGLTDLRLRELDGAHDWSVLGDLSTLQELLLDVPGIHPIPDLSGLTSLRRLTLEWDRGQERIVMSVPPLRELGLIRWGLPDLAVLAHHAESLRQLHLTAARRITGIEEIGAADGLETLRLTYCTRLQSLEPLRNLRALRRLAIDRCGKLSDFSVLAELPGLRALDLSNTAIDDLRFLRSLPNLRYLTVDGNVTDGDLTPLLELVDLQWLNIKDRKHYSHRRADIAGALEISGNVAPDYEEWAEVIK